MTEQKNSGTPLEQTAIRNSGFANESAKSRADRIMGRSSGTNPSSESAAEGTRPSFAETPRGTAPVAQNGDSGARPASATGNGTTPRPTTAPTPPSGAPKASAVSAPKASQVSQRQAPQPPQPGQQSGPQQPAGAPQAGGSQHGGRRPGDQGGQPTSTHRAVAPVPPSAPTEAKASDPNRTSVVAGVAGAAKSAGDGVSGLAAKLKERTAKVLASAEMAPVKDDAEPETRKLGAPRRTRKARLRISQVDPWSVLKTSFLFSIAAGVVLWVAVLVVWTVIGQSGLFDAMNKLIGDIVQVPGDTTQFRIQDYVPTSKVLGTAAIIAFVDVIIFTALATLAAFLYNLASAMIGGLEVTLAED